MGRSPRGVAGLPGKDPSRQPGPGPGRTVAALHFSERGRSTRIIVVRVGNGPAGARRFLHGVEWRNWFVVGKLRRQAGSRLSGSNSPRMYVSISLFCEFLLTMNWMARNYDFPIFMLRHS